MMKNMIFLLFIMTALACASLRKPSNVGADATRPTDAKGKFFYDDKNGQYYSNTDTSFSIRPTTQDRELSRIEVSIDNQEFKPYQGNIRFSTEGLHIVRFRSIDPILNLSPTQVFKVYVDATAPRIQTYWEKENHRIDQKWYVQSTSILQATATDNLAGIDRVMMRRSPEGKVEEVLGGISFAQEGLHEIALQAIDRVGNVSDWHSVRFFVDNTPPQSNLTVNGKVQANGQILYVNNGSKILLQAEDKASGVQKIEYRLNNGPVVTYKQPFSIAGDRVILHYRAIDWVENKEAWKTQEIVTDLKAPSIELSASNRHILEGGTYYALPGFMLKAKINDNESGLATTLVLLNGKEFNTTDKLEFTFSEPGSHNFILRAIDAVGNQEDSNVYAVYIDTKVEGSEIRSARDLVEKNGIWLSSLPNSLEIKGYDKGVGIDFVEISYDGSKFSRMTEAVDLAKWQTNTRTLFYRGVDRLGNKEETKSITIKIQTEAPSLDLYINSEQHKDIPLSDVLRHRGVTKKIGH